MASYDLIIKAVDNTRTSFRNIDRRLDRLDRKSRNVTKGFGGLGKAVALVGAALVTREIVTAAARFEDLNTTLKTVTGSATAGADAFKFIKEFATQTQFGVEDLTNTFIKLQSSGIEPTRKLLTTFTDAAAVTTDQVGSLNAITDLLSRTTSGGLGLEELNRLADRGIPVFNILEKQLGVTRLQVSEFGKTAEGANELVQALLTGLDQRFGGATQDRLQNLSTVLSNFRIAVTNVLAAIGTGLAPAIKLVTNNITAFLSANESFAFTVGETLGKALIGISKSIGEIITKIGLLEAGGLDRFASKITATLADFLESFGVGIDQFATTLVGAVNAIQSVLVGVSSFVPGFSAAFLKEGETIADVRQKIEDEIAAIEKSLTVSGFGATGTILKERLAGAQEELENLNNGSTVIFEKMTGDISATSEALTPLVQGLRDSSQSFADNATTAAAAAANVNAFADGQAGATAATTHVTAVLTAQQEKLKTLGTRYTELTSGITEANKAYQNNIPLVDQQKARYNEIRDLIRDLNTQLRDNTNLTDAQKTSIENATVALSAESNELHERIKSGNYLYEMLQNTSDALDTNRQRHLHLTSAIRQLEQQQLSELANQELLHVKLVALKSALAGNTEEYQRLTGAVEANNVALSASQEFYQNLIKSASDSYNELTYASEAQRQLRADLDAGRISIDVYAAGIVETNRVLGINTEQKNKNTVATKANAYAVKSAADITEHMNKTLAMQNAQGVQNGIVIGNLSGAYEKGQISIEDFRTKMSAAGLDMDDVTSKSVSLALTISDSMKTAGDALSRNLAAGLAKGKLSLNSFKDFFNQILDDILTAIIQKNITQPLVNQLTGALGGGGGGGGFNLGSLFGTPTVGAPMGGFNFGGISDFFGGFFAEGGRLGSGKYGIAGEAGPEIIKGPADVVPMNQLNTGTGESREPLTVNFNINAIDTRTGTEFLMQNKPQIIGMVSQAYNKQGRRGVVG